jgi:hypothetical protein
MRNGYLWGYMTMDKKILYVQGFMQGIEIGSAEALYDRHGAGDQTTEAMIVQYTQKVRERYQGISTIREVVLGVDRFYRDPANVWVPISFAMKYFAAKKSGSDMKSWDSWLEQNRHDGAQLLQEFLRKLE